MRVAIILVGYMRTWEQCKDSFIKTFESLHPDVYVNTYNERYGFAPYIRGLTKFDGEESITETQIRDSFSGINLVQLTVDDTKKMQEYCETIKNEIVIKYDNILSFYPQFLKLRDALVSLEQYENEHDFRYDYIIKTRTDLVYNDFNVRMEPNSVLVDAGNVFPNDVFFMTKRDTMFRISEFVCNEFFAQKYADSGSWPPHSMLGAAFRDAKLKVIPVPIVDYVARVGLNQKY